MFCRRGAIQRPVNSMLVVVIPKGCELAREVDPAPEKRAIQEFTANRADQSLDERVRDRDVGNSLNLLDLKARAGWRANGGSGTAVVIGADALRKRLAEDRVVEHPAVVPACAQGGLALSGRRQTRIWQRQHLA